MSYAQPDKFPEKVGGWRGRSSVSVLGLPMSLTPLLVIGHVHPALPPLGRLLPKLFPEPLHPPLYARRAGYRAAAGQEWAQRNVALRIQLG